MVLQEQFDEANYFCYCTKKWYFKNITISLRPCLKIIIIELTSVIVLLNVVTLILSNVKYIEKS